jgi:hypothetical protein
MEEIINQNPLPTSLKTETSSTNRFNNKWNIFLLLFLFIVIVVGFFLFSFDFVKLKQDHIVAGTTYSGTWKTSGVPSLSTKLTIESIKDNKAKIKYEWNDPKSGYTLSTTEDVSITPDHKILSWEATRANYIFTFIDTTHITGKRNENGEISTVTMTKTNE